jgi:hypothetical protein
VSNLDMNVTLQHVKQVVECLREGKPIAEGHLFDQMSWGYEPDEPGCTTAGCTWGSAYLKANGKIADKGPSDEWRHQSAAHLQLEYDIFTVISLRDEEIVDRFDEIVKLYPEAFNA